MADPVHGVMPKITYHIPEVGETEMAKGDGNGFRGQSPDERGQGASTGSGIAPSRAGRSAGWLDARTVRRSSLRLEPPCDAMPPTAVASTFKIATPAESTFRR